MIQSEEYLGEIEKVSTEINRNKLCIYLILVPRKFERETLTRLKNLFGSNNQVDNLEIL